MSALTLGRRIGEEVCIGPDITVRIDSIRGGLVKLVIAAPRNIQIDRKEIRLRKLAEATKEPS